MLASEVLLEDVAPSAPGGAAERVVASLVGLAGAGMELGVSRVTERPASWLLVSAFGALFAAGVAPLPYAVRASTVFVVGGAIGAVTLIGAAVGDWTSTASAALLSALVMLLPTGLLVRSNYCGSKTGRFVTALGLLVAIAWLIAQGPGEWFTGFDGRAGDAGVALAVSRIALVVLCFLSLLAFMGPGSTGACRAWAIGVLVWFGAQLALEGWAESAVWSQTTLWQSVSRVAGALLLVPAAVAFSHLLGVGISERARERADRATRRREAVLREAKRAVLEVRRAREESGTVERRKTG